MDIVDLCGSDNDVPARSLGVSRPVPALKGVGASETHYAWSFSNLGCGSDVDDILLQSPRSSKKRKTQQTSFDSTLLRPQALIKVNAGFDDFQDIDEISNPVLNTSSLDRNHRNSRIPGAQSKTTLKTKDGLGEISEDDLPELGAMLQNGTTLSSKTAAILAQISEPKISRRPNSDNPKSITKRLSDTVGLDLAKPVTKNESGRRQRLTSEERELRASRKEAAKEEKQRIKNTEKDKKLLQKEAEQERKKQEKALKLQERQKSADLAEINRSKIDRKMTTPEMIVYLPRSIEGNSQDNQIRELIRTGNAEARAHDSAIPGIFKWRQKVTRDFNEELGHWIRADRIDDCKFVLFLLSGERFSDLASGTDENDETIETHVTNIKSLYPDYQVIYMIEGLEAWIKRSRNAQNRAYQAAVRRIDEQERSTQQRQRKQKAAQADEEAIEEALLELQIAHSCKIQQTLNATETAEYIMSFTQQISLVRHR